MAMVAPQQQYSFMPPRQPVPSQAGAGTTTQQASPVMYQAGQANTASVSWIGPYSARSSSGGHASAGSWRPPSVDGTPSSQAAMSARVAAARGSFPVRSPEASPSHQPASAQDSLLSLPRGAGGYSPQESPSATPHRGSADHTPLGSSLVVGEPYAPRADSTRLASARGDTSNPPDFSCDSTPAGNADRPPRADRSSGPRPVATPFGMQGARWESSSPKDLPAPPPPALTTGARTSSRSPRIYTARENSDTVTSRPTAAAGSAANSRAGSHVPPVTSSLSLVPPRRSDSFMQSQPQSKVESFAPPSARRTQGTVSGVASMVSVPSNSAVPTTTAWVAGSRSPAASRKPSCSQSPRFTNRTVEVKTVIPPEHENDLIHQHVRYFMRTNPHIASNHAVARISAGLYDIDSHEVEIEWQHAAEVGKPGHLVVVDGPMRQPFGDYLLMSEANAEYDTHTIAKTSALHHVPKERRMTFDDTHKKYSRLEAMKVAKEQASIREKAADYTKEGREVPGDLVRKYNKALRQKLGRGRAQEDSPPKEKEPKERDENREPAPNNKAPAVEAKVVETKVVETKVVTTAATTAPVAPVAQATGTSITASAGSMPAEHVVAAASQQGQAQAVVAAPVFTWMAHRGISLNGMPSYLPPAQAAATATVAQPPIITRSWSGTSMPSSGTTVATTTTTTTTQPAQLYVPGVAMPAQQLSMVPPPLASARAYPAPAATATAQASTAQSSVPTTVVTTVVTNWGQQQAQPQAQPQQTQQPSLQPQP